jgi:hypothetical protein
LRNPQPIAPKENPLHEHNLSTFLVNFIEQTSRKTKRVSAVEQLVEVEEVGQKQINESNRHVFKYLQKRFKDKLLKEEVVGKKKSIRLYLTIETNEDEEDAFADELFERELEKGEPEDDEDSIIDHLA